MHTLPYANEIKEKGREREREREFFIVEISHHGLDRSHEYDSSPSMSSDKLILLLSFQVSINELPMREYCSGRFSQGSPVKASDLR